MLSLCFDIGNTRTKIGIGMGDAPLSTYYNVATETLEEELPTILASLPVDRAWIVGSISTAKPISLNCLSCFPASTRFLSIDSSYPFPIINEYATPQTLGTDRIVAILGAQSMMKKSAPILVIDAGTAITYDAASAQGHYKGGGISLGIRMRFRALHEFTARLPLLDGRDIPDIIGNSTQSSMLSGVLHGTISEIEGMARKYQQVLGGETVIFLTGGDSEFLMKHLSLTCINDRYLVLKGIFKLIQDSL